MNIHCKYEQTVRQITNTPQFEYAKIIKHLKKADYLKVQTYLCYIHYLIANQAVTYNTYSFFENSIHIIPVESMKYSCKSPP